MFSSLDISVLVHATEDKNKILECILNYLQQSIDSVIIDSIKTEGHWKNPITRIKLKITIDVDKTFEYIYDRLKINYGDEALKDYLKSNHDEKGSIYFRLDKQKICLGTIFLSDTDSIRMIFRKKGKFES